MKRSKSTISDVAEAAGVTIGTVDRVLHERGEVSEKTKEKVLRAVRELGYKANVYASMLARNESHRIAVIMPMYSAGEFWDLTHSGISKSADYAGRFSVDIVDYLYDQYDVESFLSVCREAIVDNCSAAVIAPMSWMPRVMWPGRWRRPAFRTLSLTRVWTESVVIWPIMASRSMTAGCSAPMS